MPITPLFLVMAVLAIGLLSMAVPPIPGGPLSVFTVLFVQLGIPDEALAPAVAINAILDFFMAAACTAGLQMQVTVAADTYGLGLQKDSPLTDDISAIIEGYTEYGTLDGLREKWLGSDESKKTIDVGQYDAPNGTLRYAHDSTLEPMSYVGGNGQSLGYEVELVSRIA